MKTLFGFVLALTLHNASAVEIKVSRMKAVDGMDRKFHLTTNSVPEKVYLDCQSFVQGLFIGEVDVPTVMMGAQECEALYHSINGTLRRQQKHCLDVNDDVRDYPCP